MMDTDNRNQIELNVEGMTCSNCALSITRYLERKCMESVDVNFSTSEVTFKVKDKKILPDIIKGIEGIGYKVLTEDDHSHAGSTLMGIERKFYISLILFRLIFDYARWVFPLVELKDSGDTSITHKFLLGSLLIATLGNFGRDVLVLLWKALFG